MDKPWALRMHEFDNLFRDSSWFESGLSDLPWNTEDIPDYLAWNRTPAPWHNYVAGAAVARRNDKTWVESGWRDNARVLKGEFSTFYSVGRWHLRYCLSAVRHDVTKFLKSALSE